MFCNRPEYLVSQNGGPEYLEGQNWRARIPGKSKVRGRLPRPHFGKKWTRLPGGPDYLVAAKSGPDYLGAVDWGSQQRGAPFYSFGRFSPSRTRARARGGRRRRSSCSSETVEEDKEVAGGVAQDQLPMPCSAVMQTATSSATGPMDVHALTRRPPRAKRAEEHG